MKTEPIPWAKLRHAYGPATDLPQQLQDLVSPDSQRRMEAFGELCGNIWHQGTVYEVTPHVVPLLANLLRDSSTPDRGLVAILLASISSGSGYFTCHVPSCFSREHWEKVAKRKGRTVEDLLEEESKLVATVRSVSRAIIPELIQYLKSPESEVRLSIATALRYYPEHRSLSVPALQDLLTTEVEEQVVEEIVQTLNELK